MAGVKEEWLNGKASFPSETPSLIPVEGEKNILITSALPYVNNVPHLGNIIGCVLSGDAFARYSRMMGYRTLYVCGTDEYGTATETKAIQENTTPKQICDKYHAIHSDIYKWFNIDFDHFGRTTTDHQTEICHDIFNRLHANGFTTTQTVDQLHCGNCDRFLADRFVFGICPNCGYEDARGDQCDGCAKLVNAVDLLSPRCNLCKATPTVRESKHIFLELDKLQNAVGEFVEKQEQNENNHWSPNAFAIAKGWIKGGLEKRCITRDLKWGTTVPKELEGFEDKVFYVWFDAPIGYLSITKELLGDNWTKWWKNSRDVQLYQFVGKDNVAFHSVMFPCTQIGANDGYTMVNNLCATEYLNYEDSKFSKSRGVGVFGDQAKDTGIEADVWRFYLLYMRPENQDTAFSWDDFSLKVNSELLNNLGNFINRALQFCVTNFGGVIPAMKLNEDDEKFILDVQKELQQWNKLMNDVKLRDAVRAVLSLSRLGNQYMQANAPWAAIKGDEEAKQRARTVIGVSCNVVFMLSLVLHPIMPEVSHRIRLQCGHESLPLFSSIPIAYLKEGHKIGQPKPLFVKMEKGFVDGLKVKFGGSEAAPPPKKEKAKNTKIEAGSEQKKKKKPESVAMASHFPSIARNSRQMQQLLSGATAKLNQVRAAFVSQKLQSLEKENSKLEGEIEVLVKKLVEAEKAAGIKQVDVPKRKVEETEVKNEVNNVKAETPKVEVKGKENNKKTVNDTKKAVSSSEEEVHIGRLDLRVGRILKCDKHPDADSLYVEEIDVGEGTPRTVVSGLVKHVSIEEMTNRLVVVMCNLKPAKMRGIESRAMVMCASSPEKVEVMDVDPSSIPGTPVICHPFPHIPDAQLNPKKKIWETVAEDLKVSSEGFAAWKGHPLLVGGKTKMTAVSLRGVPVK